MQIFGHKWIESKKFKKVFSQDAIKKTSTDDIVILEPLTDSIKLAQYCQKNNIPFAITISSTKEALFANALHASFVVCQMEDASMIQAIAQDYLFDTKVIALINDEKEIEKMAQLSIDGVIFHEAISLD